MPFVKLNKDHFFTPRSYPAGSVVELTENDGRLGELLKKKVAALHPGPAYEPAAEVSRELEATSKQVETFEKATLQRPPEKAVRK